MRSTLRVTLDKDEVKKALIQYALSKIDLGEKFDHDGDVAIESCCIERAALIVRPNSDLRDRNGGLGA